ncbi:hypothetical protein [Actinokineospora sp. HUAS TT18]|uniref:hypothetical protein n=1 Tax=Actinokineospora sp. HUAS TT18 TaxID=3447451 RepID=UPI003F5207B9
MTTHTTPAVEPTALGDTTVDDLIARAGDLKGELVAFAQSPQFARRLDALLFDAADRRGHLDEATAVLTIDHFALQCRLSGGRTVVERFVSQRQPRLSDDERAMVLGWRDVVEGYFEVRRFDCDAVELHNLVDDLVYRVYSNMGRSVFALLRRGMFVMGRIVPVHPATDAWLVSGHFAPFPKSARREIAQTVAQQVAAHPEVLRRNPVLLQRGWEVQAEHRAEFIAQVGSDLVVLLPHDARETLCEHYRRLRENAVARLEGKAAKRAATTGPAPGDLSRLPDELLDADSVALVYDEVEGLCFYRDFDRSTRCSPTPHWSVTVPVLPSCASTSTTSRCRRRRSAAWSNVTPTALTRSFARFCANLASPGRGTGRNCCNATRSPSSTANRCPVSRSSANASPSFSARRDRCCARGECGSGAGTPVDRRAAPRPSDAPVSRATGVLPAGE